MAEKRKHAESFIDLTQDSEDEKPVAATPSKKVATNGIASGASRPSALAQEPIGATPKTMRSREIIDKLKQLGAPQRVIDSCVEKKDLVDLLSTYQRRLGLPGLKESANQVLGTPPTHPRPAKVEPGARLHSQPAGAASSASTASVTPAIMLSKPSSGGAGPSSAAGFESSSYTGPRQGWVFKKGEHGIGYYRDVRASAGVGGAAAVAATRVEHSFLARQRHGGSKGRSRGTQRCPRCHQKIRRCMCALLAPPRRATGAGGAYGRGGSDDDDGRAGVSSRAAEARDEREDAEVGISHKDADEQTFIEYVPHTFSAQVFMKHPDPVVETASLSSLMPPKTTHKLRLCAKTITGGLLTNLQLETINLACQQHELRLPKSGARAAFFMGDGPGVGKGRQAAGIIMENYLHGREKALWLSVSGDLVADARRDIEDIGGGKIACYNLKDFKPSFPLEKQGLTKGILFCTYSLLTSERAGASKVEAARLNQIIQWCGAEAFEGALVLDECHKAKNMGNGKTKSDKVTEEGRDDLDAWKKSTATKSAMFVASLQQQLPLARIVYLSATGASDPKHFCNLARLGLWGPGTAFKDQFDFIDEMHKGGIGGMELVAMHMKVTGQYMARSLSFKDASFEIVEVNLRDEFREMYDKSVLIWQKLIAHPEWWNRPSVHPGARPRNMMGLLWSAHLRFYSQMVMAAKIPDVVEIVKKSLSEGMCCVIGLQTTGEAAGGSDGDAQADELFSNAANAILKLVEDHCNSSQPGEKKALLKEIRELRLPPNPLDDLIDQLGGPGKVAEMTGRASRWVKTKKNGTESWKMAKRVKDDRGELTVNVEERKMFQTGRKLVAIISEAASSGISLQADRRCGNQRRRVHITLQLPWASDQVVQQMGRSHRSNQSSAPIFKLMMTPIGGEWRFASAVARRLQALGALTQGDRRASGTGGSSIQAYNIENFYGMKALKDFMQQLDYGCMDGGKAVPDFIVDAFPGMRPADSITTFLEEARRALDAAGFCQSQYAKSNSKLKTFLNRVLGVSLELQNVIFRYFMHLMTERINKDKNSGEYQEGIVDIAGSVIEVMKEQDLFECPRTGAKTTRVLLRTDRGLSWDKATEMLKEHIEYAKEKGLEDKDSGFYTSRDTHDHVAGCKPIVLVLQQRTAYAASTGKMRSKMFHIVRPNTGHSSIVYDWEHVNRNFEPADPTLAATKGYWERLFNFYEKKCGHKNCAFFSCSYKKRTTNHHLIVGLVLPFWKDVKRVMKNPKVVRVQPTDGSKRLVGLRVWPDRIDEVCDVITRGGQSADSGDDDDRLQRIVPSPFGKVVSTLVLHDCLNPAARDNISFDLPQNWNLDPASGGKTSCIVTIYEIPLQNALLDQSAPLKAARWRSDSQLRVVDEHTQRETVVPVHTGNVAKHSVVSKPVKLDDHVKEGKNHLRVQSIGERFCLVVQLVTSRPLDAVLTEMSVVSEEAENLEWGKTALLKQLGHGEDDDDLVVTELDVSLKDPLMCARIRTPARGKECQHFNCFDLGVYLQYAEKYGSFRCQICSKELNPQTVTVCKRFQTILQEVDAETDSCKLNAEFEITNALSARSEAKQEDAEKIRSKAMDGDAAAEEDDFKEEAPSVQAGTPLEQLVQTGLWEYTKEAEDFFEEPGTSENAGKDEMQEDGKGPLEEDSDDDSRPVLSSGRRRRLQVLSEQSETEASDISQDMDLDEDQAPDGEGGHGSGDGRSRGSGSRAKEESSKRVSNLRSRPVRSARARTVRYEDPATDEAESADDSNHPGVSSDDD